MNLNTIYTSSQDNQLLTDGNWQKADCYNLETSSSFWNKAMIIILPKDVAKTNDEALLYLLQKQAKALTIWQAEWNTTTPTVHQFIQFFIAQRGFTNTIGKLVSAEIFYENYSETIKNITTDPSFEFTKNDKPEVYFNLIDKNAIKNVICFDDHWQEENYLIETETHWILYHWNTVV